MAYDEGLAKQMRGDLGDLPGLTEKKMFGGMVDAGDEAMADNDIRRRLSTLALEFVTPLPRK